MMFTNENIFLECCMFFVTLIGIHVLYLIVRNELAYRKFKSLVPHIPMSPRRNLLTGHSMMYITGCNNWRNLDSHHEKLGKTFAFFHQDKPYISTVDLELIKRILIDEANIHPNRPEQGIPAKEYSDDNILFSRDNKWRKIRRAFAPAFCSHKIKSSNVQADIQYVIDRFIDAIEEKLQREKRLKKINEIELDSDDLFQRYSMDLTFTTLYKQSNVIDHRSATDYWRELHHKAERHVANPIFLLAFTARIFNWIVRIVFQFDWHSLAVSRTKILNFINQQTKLYFLARKENASREEKTFSETQQVTLKDGTKFRRNLTDIIIEKLYDGTLTEGEYFSSSFFLFNAGSKSTSDFLARLFYFLSRDQNVQQKLRDSINSGGEKSEYLSWCMNETLRVYPSVMICTRILGADVESNVGVIPKGTNVVTPVYSIQHLRDYWGEDADEFRPERWADSKDFHPVQYVPFGAGKRNCIGAEFAFIHSKKLICQMLQKFHLKLSSKPVDLNDFVTPLHMFVVTRTPIHVVISPIEESSHLSGSEKVTSK